MQRRLVWPVAIFSALLGGLVAVAVVEGLDLGGSGTHDGRAAGSARRLADRQRQRGPGAHRGRHLQARRPRRRLHPRQDRPAHGLGVRLRVPAAAAGHRDRLGVRDRPATARSSPTRTSSTARRRSACTFADKQRVDAKVVGKDRSTDLALLKVDPKRPEPHAADPRLGQGRPGRRPGRRDRQPVRPGPHADHGRRLGGQRADQRPQRLPIDDVHPDRRRDQPRQLRRPAHRRHRQGDRDQLADRDRRHAATATSASASPSRSTPPSKILPQLEKWARQPGYLGISALTIDSSLKDLNLPVEHGALVQTRDARQPGRPRPASRPATSPRTLDGATDHLGGDIIVKVDDKNIHSDEELQSAIADSKPGRHGQGDADARRQDEDGHGDARRASGPGPGQP